MQHAQQAALDKSGPAWMVVVMAVTAVMMVVLVVAMVMAEKHDLLGRTPRRQGSLFRRQRTRQEGIHI